MTTKSHKYLARTFFNDESINKMISNNYVSINQIIDTSAITIGDIEEPEVFESIYEEQILKRDEGNDLYKIIEVKGDNYKGYMAVIYDPSRISLATARYFGKGGQTIDKIVANEKAFLGINASGFSNGAKEGNNLGSLPSGNVIKNGKVIWDTGHVGNLIGFNNDNVLFLTKSTAKEAVKNGMKDAVEFGPFLIVNGEPATIGGNGGWGIAPRTAIAQRKDGIVLLLVVDGRSSSSLGVDMQEIINIFIKYKAYNAANLDGGYSSIMYENGKIVNGIKTMRYLPTAFVVK
ncbi:MAG: phosphodiester glycosidase family protein [Clostridium sp.]|nr:phosphodiester glycosidase family protein [Clostridium sp.]MCM1444023.1 phosphodiester glycosidase family protein [Candidatus Amulumruptor caecigallinarius]